MHVVHFRLFDMVIILSIFDWCILLLFTTSFLTVVHVVHVQTASHSTPHHDCAGTKLCMMTCRTTYMLGERGSDGCQSCTCLPGMWIY